MANDNYDIFNDEAQEVMEEAIRLAELNTSGEVRIHIDNKCKEELMDRAAFLFEELEMHQTELRNGVLFYFALKDKQFAILGDGGINAKVPDTFWDDIRDEMTAFFKEGKFVEGITHGVKRAGEQLKAFFPYQSDDINELPNEISFGTK
jgi:uncharacterized membrane protein